MNIKTHWKRLLREHRHTAVGFLIGLTLTLFLSTLTGSDARVYIPKGARVLQPPVAATLVAVEPELHPAPEASSSSSVSSELPESSSSLPESSSSSAAKVTVPVSSSSAEPLSGTVSSESSSFAPSLSSSVSSSVAPVGSSTVPDDGFPPFVRTVSIVSRIPNWGAMRTPAEWNRTYDEMTDEDFVRVPAYQIAKLTVPMKDLTDPITPETIPEITRKLYYSTRYFGAYDLDAGEFTSIHPGVDLKLARGTPVGAIAGGRVHSVSTSENLGLHVIIEHHINGEAYYSIYGHFDSVSVSAGQTVVPGQIIGKVGMTGHTSAPHVHLQIDRGAPGEADHEPYLPSSIPSPAEASRHVVNPMVFIGAHGNGQ